MFLSLSILSLIKYTFLYQLNKGMIKGTVNCIPLGKNREDW